MTTQELAAGWSFDNSYARLPDVFFKKQLAVPVRAPQLIILNEPLASSLGLNAQSLRSAGNVDVMAGNRVPEGAEPLAQAYAGHQFGHFNMLGDGRALLLGEQITPQGERLDIQLKGSGLTPYSRGGDGRAALGPMLREYIISEAMHALGIPTTRSLAVVTTGEKIVRESLLTGAILTRVAASHLRVGTFQYAAALGQPEALRALADYALQRHYPQALEAEHRYLALLQEVIQSQAKLIAQWMCVGFIHGVMNTDNMSISGETIDYGPCAFMDTYDPATVFSSIDRQGRYAYGNQPSIGAWNLARLAESLLPLLGEDEERAIEQAEEALKQFGEQYHHEWLRGMRVKLGLFHAEDGDKELILDLLGLMQTHRADYTNTFLALTFGQAAPGDLAAAPEYVRWQERWRERRERQPESDEQALELQRSSNPALIPRNHQVEAALSAAEEGDLSVMERLLEALADPYAHRPQQCDYAALPEPSDLPYRTYCGT